MASKELKNYVRTIGVVWAMLLLLGFAAGMVIPDFDVSVAAATIGCMALNAFAAIAPIYLLPKLSPINVYLGGMVARLFLIGIVLVAVLLNLDPSGQAVLLGSMVLSFVVFLTAEIKHLLAHPLQAGNS